MKKHSKRGQGGTTTRASRAETPRDLLDGESHYVWSDRYLLQILESERPPHVELKHRKMLLYVRAGTNQDRCRSILNDWYRQQVTQAIPPLLARWETRLGVKAKRFVVRRMKTIWGSCNCRFHVISLNTRLAQKPPACLEYVVVHELMHILEPSHNSRFVALMDQFMPEWRSHRQTLDSLPVYHQNRQNNAAQKGAKRGRKAGTATSIAGKLSELLSLHGLMAAAESELATLKRKFDELKGLL